MTEISQVLDFWFAEGMAARWFKKDPAFDAEVRERLGAVYESAARGELDHWKETAEGCVALVVLLDQVPRNIFRNHPRAFATDAQALAVAREAIERGIDRGLPQTHRIVLYMPLEHSENITDQEDCCRLVAELDDNPQWLDYAHRHREVVARFGRFPHRNAVLGRESSDEEKDFLAQPGAGF